MARTAFIILKSPQEQDPTHFMGRFSDQLDASAILVEDGVYQATLRSAAERLKKTVSEVLVSDEDLLARGFSEKDLKVGRSAGYADIVDCIMERTERSITV